MPPKKTGRPPEVIKREAAPLNAALKALQEAWRETMWRDDVAPGEFARLKAEYERESDALDERLNELESEYQTARRRKNPDEPAKAIRMFRRFHTRDWRGEGDFHPSLEIPDTVACLGDAKNILYRSDKLNPTDSRDEGWIDYIHEHDGGVHTYAPARGGGDTNVPAWLMNVTELTWLGKCLGFAYRVDGKTCEAKGTEPLPELYTIPSGKALLVIQSKRTLLALIWGGRLGVERRGIVH